MAYPLMLLITTLLGPVLASTGPAPVVVEDTPPRRGIRFFFQNRQETKDIVLLDATGAATAEAVSGLSHFVRCFRTNHERPIHPRLAEIVARVAEAFGRDEVDVVSGYRARPFGAPQSKHFLGRAMDLQLPGVPARAIASWVWKNFRGVGVGLYPHQNFVHIDVRDVDVRWTDMSRQGESGHARYTPRLTGERLPDAAPQLPYDASRKPGYARLVSLPVVGFRGGF